jgi:hypothetical protein
MISARPWCIVGVAARAIVGCGSRRSDGGRPQTKVTATGIATLPTGPYDYAVDRGPLSRVAHIRALVAPAGGGRPRDISKRRDRILDQPRSHRGVYGLAIAPDGSSLMASMPPPANDRGKLAVYLYQVKAYGRFLSGPWRNRTSNLGIKSPLLCQLS